MATSTAHDPAIEDGALGLRLFGERRDLLSDVLASVRLRGERLAAYGPPAEFTMRFAGIGALHIIEQGELRLRVNGDDHAERLGSGDVVLLPRGDSHELASAEPGAERVQPTRSQVAAPASSAEAPRWLCGTFAIEDSHASYLLAGLPSMIVLRGARDQALEWLEVSRRMLLFEMQSPSQGSAVMVARILDLLLIQILRLWGAANDTEPSWLVGALDPEISPALAAMHTEPGGDWTVDALARECNLSRSAFAERFSLRVGKPPATYLADVRLGVAASLLRARSVPLALVADQVGYTSVEAFSRAFRQRYGKPPAHWGRAARLADAARDQ